MMVALAHLNRMFISCLSATAVMAMTKKGTLQSHIVKQDIHGAPIY